MFALKRVLVVALATAGMSVPAASAARIQNAAPRHACPKLFTVHMTTRAARAVYSGARHIRHRELRMLGWMEHCERNLAARAFVVTFDHRQARNHHARVRQKIWTAQHPLQHAVASWYNDAGGTACGFHAQYGVANKTLPCGTQVTFYYGGRSVTAVVQDRGPFVSGRTWDLNQGTAGALGFDGVQTVGYRIG